MAEKILCSDYQKNVALLVNEKMIKVVCCEEAPFGYVSEELRQMFLTNGYKGVPHNQALVRLVFAFDGAPLDSLKAEIIKRAAKRRAMVENEERRRILWDQLPEYLRFLIVGIYALEFYSTGFSVYINLSTGYTFEQQRLLLRRGKNDVAQWLKRALAEPKSAQYRKAVNLLPFVHISSWAIARNNQAVYRYELNQQLMDVMLKADSD